MEMISYAVDLLKDLLTLVPSGFHAKYFFDRWSKTTIQQNETVFQQIYRIVENFLTEKARILTGFGHADPYGSQTSSTTTNYLWWNHIGLETLKSAAADVFKSSILHSVASVGLVIFFVSLWWRYKTCHKSKPEIQKKIEDANPTNGADHDSDNSELEAFHTASLDSSSSIGYTSFASAACYNSDRSSRNSGSPSYSSSTSTDLCSMLPEKVRFCRKILTAPSIHLFSSSSSETSPDIDVTSRSDSPHSSQSEVSFTRPEMRGNRDCRTIIHPEILSSSSSSAASLKLPLGPDYAEGMSISMGSYSLAVLEILGRGTQATLYKVSRGYNTYAAKLCHAHTISLDVLHEFEILAGLNHPNVVAVYQQIPRGFLMECLFQDLVTLIESTRYLAPPVRNRISVGILKGVNHIHMFGVAHLDIKPENILLTPSGEPKLADFGLSVKYLREDGSWRHLESFRGTPQYVAPEMYSNEPILDLSKSDCWSVGVTLYAMMSGQPLFDGTTEEEIHFNQMHGNYSYPPHLSTITPADTDYYSFMEMVKDLCRLDPALRLTARQALCHGCL